MRYTARHSLRSLWQTWLAVNPEAKGLSEKGRTMALTARHGYKPFEKLVKAEMDTAGGPRRA